MPVLSHVTKVFGIRGAKIYKVTADNAGAATTYGAGVSLVGANHLKLTFGVDSKDLFGDGVPLDVDSVIKHIEGEITFAKLSLDVWTALTSASATDSGITPAQISKIDLASPVTFNAFKLEAQSLGVDVQGAAAGDIHYLLGKCKAITLPDPAMIEMAYAPMTFKFHAVPPQGTGSVWFDIVENETAIALP